MVNWTEKRVARLKLFHKQGFSASAIAKKLGPAFTKGMVAGKISRLGLSAKSGKRCPKPKQPIGHANSEVNGKAVALKPAPSPKPKPATVRPAAGQQHEAAVIRVPPGLRLYDLREGHCRWPLGDDIPAKLFCGAPTVPSKSWCEHHYRMAYGHAPPPQTQELPGQALLRAVHERTKPGRAGAGCRSPQRRPTVSSSHAR